MEKTKNRNTVNLVLPFPHFLWILGTNANVLHKQQSKHENINYEKDK